MAGKDCAVFRTRTEEIVKTYYRKWELPNFNSLLDEKATSELRTEFDDPTFQLKIEFTRHDDEIGKIYFLSRKYVSLKVSLTVDFYVCDRIAQIVINVNPDYNTVQANEWQYLTTLLESGIQKYLKRGTLSLNFQFIVFNNAREVRVDVPEAQLSNDFENLLNNGLYSDVTMKSVEGVEYKVHKGVLASRSEVLKATFEHNTTECSTNIIETHLESDVLREVLTFIYSDKAPRVDKMAEKLLAAADYYQLNRLKRLSERELYKKLTVENAIETLQLADLHSANTLKQLTLEFIKDGRASHILLNTEGWAQLNSVELFEVIYEHIKTHQKFKKPMNE